MTINDRLSVVSPNGDTTHVLVPKDEYDRLTRGGGTGSLKTPNPDAIAEALQVLRNPKSKWHDANEVVAQLLANGLAAERKARRLSQTELGARLGMAQSQVSRYEKNPDGITIGVLRQIAAALANLPKPSTPAAAAAPRRASTHPKRKAG